jgi:hypothetical protein
MKKTLLANGHWPSVAVAVFARSVGGKYGGSVTSQGCLIADIRSLIKAGMLTSFRA